VEGPVDPPDEIADRLGLEEGDKVAVRRRRRFADGDLVQLADSFIPWDIAQGTQVLEKNSGPGGIYARIEEQGHELAEFDEQIRAALRFPRRSRRSASRRGCPSSC
jgi:GntR family transcriptional regulator